jgi:hypothetical protein
MAARVSVSSARIEGYGGAVRLPEWARGHFFVWIIDTDNPEPVFHRLRNMIGPDRPYVARMGCGKTDRNRQGLAARLRLDHAVVIARPCRTCFTEAPEWAESDFYEGQGD